MRRVVLLALIALALPLVAFADSSIDITNSGGTLTGTTNLSVSNSTIIAIKGLNGGGLITGSNLGTFAFTTGALTSGSLAMGGTFAAGGTITITGNGMNGVPNGVIFSGTFTCSPNCPTWTFLPVGANGSHSYTFSGAVAGKDGVVGAVVQLTVITGKGFFSGATDISSGDTNLTVPEPGTLVLLGTGLLGVGGLLRKKIRL